MVTFEKLLTWFANHADSRSDLVTKAAGHGQPRDVFTFEPDPKRANRLFILVAETVHAPIRRKNAGSLIRLARLLIPRYRLCLDLVIGDLAHNRTRVSDVDTEKLLTQGHHTDTRAP